MNRLLAEALGTFRLVFAGTGAIIVNQTTGGTVSQRHPSATFPPELVAQGCLGVAGRRGSPPRPYVIRACSSFGVIW